MLNVLRFEYGSMQLDPFKNGVELKIVKSFGEKEVSLKAIDKAFRQVALMDYRAEKKPFAILQNLSRSSFTCLKV